MKTEHKRIIIFLLAVLYIIVFYYLSKASITIGTHSTFSFVIIGLVGLHYFSIPGIIISHLLFKVEKRRSGNTSKTFQLIAFLVAIPTGLWTLFMIFIIALSPIFAGVYAFPE